MNIFIIILGASIGALLRYAIGLLFVGSAFPYATLSVNVLGSALLGVVSGILISTTLAKDLVEPAQLFLIVGLLSSFTTFSAFSLETMNHLLNGQVAVGMMNISLNVVLCLLAVGAGLMLSRVIV